MANGGNITKVTEEYLKRKTKEFDITCIYSLQLSSLGIFDLGCISECVGLAILDLSNNKISSVRLLAPLKQLQMLNISCNRISDLSGLEQLESLFSLDLCSNFINSIDSLRPLKQLEKFGHLRLNDTVEGFSNPVCENNASYREELMALLPDLKTLDGQFLSGKGSEFSELCRQMDVALKAVEVDAKQRRVISLSRETYPSISLESQAQTNDLVIQNEKRFEELLRDCEQANEKAEKTARLAEDNLRTL